MVTQPRPADIELVGGNRALDLANTLEGPVGPPADIDHLATPADLALWLRRVGIEPVGDADDRLLARARVLRGAVADVFLALAEDDAPDPAALGALLRATAGGRLVPDGAVYRLQWRDDPLAPIAQDGVDLLRSGPLDRVKHCDVCRWLFVDASRNRSRRWCSMGECGGRSKMRRYRARRATGRG